MAAGAQSRDVLSQFLVEALTFSPTGGVLGIAVGIVGGHPIGYFAEWRNDQARVAARAALSIAPG